MSYLRVIPSRQKYLLRYLNFDIGITTNTTLPIYVESFVQMMYRVHDCPKRIIAMSEPRYKNPFERQSGNSLIRSELAISRLSDASTAIKNGIVMDFGCMISLWH